MTLRTETLIVTTDASGAGTVSTSQPINGYVTAIRNDSSFGGTADYTFTTGAAEGAGTVISMTDKAAPFTAYVGGSVEGLSSGQAFLGVPVDGYLTMVVAQGGATNAGTIVVFYDGER